jgi:hypothetical protein
MRIALSGRGRRSVRPQRLGRRTAAPGHRGTGKKEQPSRSDKTKPNRGGGQGPKAAYPRGKKELFTK